MGPTTKPWLELNHLSAQCGTFKVVRAAREIAVETVSQADKPKNLAYILPKRGQQCSLSVATYRPSCQ